MGYNLVTTLSKERLWVPSEREKKAPDAYSPLLGMVQEYFSNGKILSDAEEKLSPGWRAIYGLSVSPAKVIGDYFYAQQDYEKALFFYHAHITGDYVLSLIRLYATSLSLDKINPLPFVQSIYYGSVLNSSIGLGNFYAQMLIRRKRFTEAFFVLNRHIAGLNVHESDLGLLLSYADCLTDSKRPEEALCLLRDIAEVRRPSVGIFTRLGMAYLAIGQKGKAKIEFRNALKLKPNHKPAEEQLKKLS